MGIYFEQERRIIGLNTDHTTYQMQIDENGYLLHLYYGALVGSCPMDYMQFYSDCGFSPNPYHLQERRDFSLDNIPQEYTGGAPWICGSGFYRAEQTVYGFYPPKYRKRQI